MNTNLKYAAQASAVAFLLLTTEFVLAADNCIRFEVRTGFDRIHNSCSQRVNVTWFTGEDVSKGYGASSATVPANDYTNISDIVDGIRSWGACIYPKSPSGLKPTGGSYTCR